MPGTGLGKARVLCWVLGALIGAVLLRRIFVSPAHFSVWAFGDAQYYNAGRHFAEEGFAAHHFLPQVDPGNPHSLIANNGPNGRYPHYPALQALLNGLGIEAAYLAGIGDDVAIKRGLQLFYVAISFAGIAFLFLALSRVYGDSLAGLTALFLMLSPWMTGFADNLTDQPVDILFWGLLLWTCVKVYGEGVGKNFHLGLAALSFLISQNGIEIPMFAWVFPLVYGMIAAAGGETPFGRVAASWALSVALPIACGFILHFGQVFWDFGAVAFLRTWLGVFRGRGGITHTAIGRIANYIRLTGTAYFGAALALFVIWGVFWLIAMRRAAPELKKRLYGKIGFALAFAAGMWVFPSLLPIQAGDMWPYSGVYTYAPAFLCGLVFLMDHDVVVSYGLASLPWRRLPGALGAAWCLYSFVSVGGRGLRVLASPLSMTRSPASSFWNIMEKEPSQVAVFSRPDVRSAIQKATAPTDILIFPPEFQGPSPIYMSPVIEFYLRRHCICWPEAELGDLCRFLESDRKRQEGRFKAYVRPRLFLLPHVAAREPASGIVAGMREYRCQASAADHDHAGRRFQIGRKSAGTGAQSGAGASIAG